jgi:hypothetical protein
VTGRQRVICNHFVICLKNYFLFVLAERKEYIEKLFVKKRKEIIVFCYKIALINKHINENRQHKCLLLFKLQVSTHVVQLQAKTLYKNT